ncbi:MAG TPA: DUF5302 domain-containing protein [Candidatus Avipropionibacterium avicola]|uniref:DUF5302 domain-containing protein n=1 Tax=Candidatus Avipropionibacterium avicola TaxID=2840701 RepID=A0A9D1KLU6_9ACTN|nr:DUF5302 domain-containing protein [Candidatus Avipropionibacterium avicola]
MAQHAQGPEKTSGAPENPADEIKRRMKEALERKNQRNAHGVDPSDTESQGAATQKGMHGVSAPVDNQSYRRKAGGGGS